MSAAVRVRRRLRLRLALLLAAVLCVGLMSVGAPAAYAIKATSKCQFAVLITVRGINAPAGSQLQNGRVWLKGGHGAQLQPLVDAMVKTAPYPVWTESLAWQANLSSNSFYEAQKNSGVNKLVDEIKSIYNGCGTRPVVFLAGHSGGAHVVMDALVSLSGSHYSSIIRGAVVYGDPTNRESMPWRAPGSVNAGGIFKRSDAGVAALKWYQYYGWSFDRPRDPKPAYYPEIRSYCNSGDWACAGNIAYAWDQKAHNSYTSKTSDAKNWLMYMVNEF